MNHYAMFSVGDYELDEDYLAEFGLFDTLGQIGRVIRGKDGVPALTEAAESVAEGKPGIVPRAKEAIKKIGAGVRKAHTRVRDGKTEWVKQSLQKAGDSTAGALQAVKNVGGKGLEIAKNNKLAVGAGGAAGLALVGAAGYALSRKKRERR